MITGKWYSNARTFKIDEKYYKAYNLCYFGSATVQEVIDFANESWTAYKDVGAPMGILVTNAKKWMSVSEQNRSYITSKVYLMFYDDDFGIQAYTNWQNQFEHILIREIAPGGNIIFVKDGIKVNDLFYEVEVKSEDELNNPIPNTTPPVSPTITETDIKMITIICPHCNKEVFKISL